MLQFLKLIIVDIQALSLPQDSSVVQQASLAKIAAAVCPKIMQYLPSTCSPCIKTLPVNAALTMNVLLTACMLNQPELVASTILAHKSASNPLLGVLGSRMNSADSYEAVEDWNFAEYLDFNLESERNF